MNLKKSLSAMTNEQILRSHTVGRLASDPKFLAWHLTRYCEIEGVSHEELSQILQLGPTDYSRLGLCLSPDTAVSDFANRIRNIAEYIGVDAAQLAQLVRLVAIHYRQATSNGAKIIPLDSINSGGLLMAAREKNDPDPEVNSQKPA